MARGLLTLSRRCRHNLVRLRLAAKDRGHLDVVGALKTGRDPGRVARRSGARDVGAIEVHL